MSSHKSLRMNTIKKKNSEQHYILHRYFYFYINFVIWIGRSNKSVNYLQIYQPTVQYVQWHIAVQNRGSCCSTNGQIIGNKRVQKVSSAIFCSTKVVSRVQYTLVDFEFKIWFRLSCQKKIFFEKIDKELIFDHFLEFS